MQTAISILVFIFGSIIGSFLNVCIHRIPKNESIVFPASHCPLCKKDIAWYDNIPILSYVALRGRCRFCDTRIPLRYPIVEILTPVVLLILFTVFGVSAKFFAYSMMACGLIVATFIDFAIQEIPDQISLGGLVAGIIMSLLFPSIFDTASRWAGLLNSVAGAVIGGGSIFLLGFFGELVFKKEAMGGGDVKLMAMIGAFLGWKLVLFTFFVAPVFGAAVGVVQRIKYGKETIPYGPYLSLAALVAIVWGNRILSMFYGLY